jgi:hypothetical protein
MILVYHDIVKSVYQTHSPHAKGKLVKQIRYVYNSHIDAKLYLLKFTITVYIIVPVALQW